MNLSSRLRSLLQAANRRLDLVSDDPYYGAADVRLDELAAQSRMRGREVMPASLTEAQKAMFDAVTGDDPSLALVSTVLDGQPLSAIACVEDDGEGGLFMTPLYIECIPAIFDRLVDPAAGL